jgi:hypothetical protein
VVARAVAPPGTPDHLRRSAPSPCPTGAPARQPIMPWRSPAA